MCQSHAVRQHNSGLVFLGSGGFTKGEYKGWIYRGLMVHLPSLMFLPAFSGFFPFAFSFFRLGLSLLCNARRFTKVVHTRSPPEHRVPTPQSNKVWLMAVATNLQSRCHRSIAIAMHALSLIASARSSYKSHMHWAGVEHPAGHPRKSCGG